MKGLTPDYKPICLTTSLGGGNQPWNWNNNWTQHVHIPGGGGYKQGVWGGGGIHGISHSWSCLLHPTQKIRNWRRGKYCCLKHSCGFFCHLHQLGKSPASKSSGWPQVPPSKRSHAVPTLYTCTMYTYRMYCMQMAECHLPILHEGIIKWVSRH